jgi:hypothetical protein
MVEEDDDDRLGGGGGGGASALDFLLFTLRCCVVFSARPLTCAPGAATDDDPPPARSAASVRLEAIEKHSAELGDWLLRMNGGEGMSGYARSFIFERDDAQALNASAVRRV